MRKKAIEVVDQTPSEGRSGTVGTEGVLDAVIETLQLGVAEIQKEIKLIASGKGSESKHDKGSRIAFLTGKLGPVLDAIRKIEAARAQRAGAMTPATVLAYLRRCEPAARRHVLSQLEVASNGGSVLG